MAGSVRKNQGWHLWPVRNGNIAQLAEQLPVKQKDAGSSLAVPAIYADIVQGPVRVICNHLISVRVRVSAFAGGWNGVTISASYTEDSKFDSCARNYCRMA